jgi:hypothetical protein
MVLVQHSPLQTVRVAPSLHSAARVGWPRARAERVKAKTRRDTFFEIDMRDYLL